MAHTLVVLGDVYGEWRSAEQQGVHGGVCPQLLHKEIIQQRRIKKTKNQTFILWEMEVQV